jgi:hypothetical protein
VVIEMMRKILAATAALALCACAGSSRDTGAAATCSAIAIANVTVLPMTDVAELRDQTVIVEDGRITRIDAAACGRCRRVVRSTAKGGS